MHIWLIIFVWLYLLLLSPSLSQILPWDEFKREFDFEYSSKLEDSARKAIFENNRNKIEKFNTEQSKIHGYEQGLNSLCDKTREEFAKLHGFKVAKNFSRKNTPEAQQHLVRLLENVGDLPKDLDYTKIPGRVSPVKDQGLCGSDWAFSATGALEGQMVPRNISMIPLSAQNLIDCSRANHGCDGGIMLNAFNDINIERGINSDERYPYTGYQDKCKFDKSKVVFSDYKGASLEEGDEIMLQRVVATFGPVSVSIDASHDFMYYKSGVYYDKWCSKRQEDLSHPVLIVGYGTEITSYNNKTVPVDFWLVKNSWGSKWGQNGFIKMARNRDNNCGIATWAQIPILGLK